MSFLTRILLVTLLSGPCISHNQEEFIILTLKSIAARQDSLVQKFDDLEEKRLAQHEILEDKLLAQQEKLENMKLSVGRCSTNHQISTFHDFLAKDECEMGTDNCSINATCRDLPIYFECSCMAGYSGDGVICEDIDECIVENKCHERASCTNTHGSFNCQCLADYVGDGYTCDFVCISPNLELEPFGCIKYVEERMTWNDAQAKCNADGGSLLYGFTRQQLTTICDYFLEQFGMSYYLFGNGAFVGVQGGLFVKSPSDGDPPGISPDTDLWSKGETGEQCAYADLFPSLPNLWGDDCSDHRRGSLCQILY